MERSELSCKTFYQNRCKIRVYNLTEKFAIHLSNNAIIMGKITTGPT